MVATGIGSEDESYTLGDGVGHEQRERNAQFIADAPEIVAWLIAEVDRLGAENAALAALRPAPEPSKEAVEAAFRVLVPVIEGSWSGGALEHRRRQAERMLRAAYAVDFPRGAPAGPAEPLSEAIEAIVKLYEESGPSKRGRADYVSLIPCDKMEALAQAWRARRVPEGERPPKKRAAHDPPNEFGYPPEGEALAQWEIVKKHLAAGGTVAPPPDGEPAP
jgi:hypothetical protein